jgi:hypothetical protein
MDELLIYQNLCTYSMHQWIRRQERSFNSLRRYLVADQADDRRRRRCVP